MPKDGGGPDEEDGPGGGDGGRRRRRVRSRVSRALLLLKVVPMEVLLVAVSLVSRRMGGEPPVVADILPDAPDEAGRSS